MELSIIIPAYNCVNYIYDCIMALVHQNMDYEIIIIDDGSTDGTSSKCDELALTFPIVKVIHKKNEGQGIARNLGIDVAKGKYVAFVDADDIPEGNAYTEALKKIKDYGADLCICNWDRFSSKEDLHKFKYDRNEVKDKQLSNIEIISSMSMDKNHYSSAVWNKIYKLETIRSLNIKFISERTVISEDFLFNYDFISKSRKSIWVDICLYHYRVNDNSYCRKYQENYFTRLIELKKALDTRSNIMEDSNCCYYKLYSFIKTCIIQEVMFQEISVAKHNIAGICSNEYTTDILSHINYVKLNRKNKVIYMLIKKRFSILLYYLYKKYTIFSIY